MGFTPSWLFLVAVYIVLSVINSYGVFLYYKACVQMHRTVMIQSVFYVLCALLLENIYFLIVSISRGFNWSIVFILEHPLFWSIPKIILAISLLYFIIASLSPTKELDCIKNNLFKDKV